MILNEDDENDYSELNLSIRTIVENDTILKRKNRNIYILSFSMMINFIGWFTMAATGGRVRCLILVSRFVFHILYGINII